MFRYTFSTLFIEKGKLKQIFTHKETCKRVYHYLNLCTILKNSDSSWFQLDQSAKSVSNGQLSKMHPYWAKCKAMRLLFALDYFFFQYTHFCHRIVKPEQWTYTNFWVDQTKFQSEIWAMAHYFKNTFSDLIKSSHFFVSGMRRCTKIAPFWT